MFQIVFYETERGDKPIEYFLDSLKPKMRAKTVSMLELLEEYGNQLTMPYSRYLRNGIYELRITQGNDISRLLYFFCRDQKIIITNGFIKKRQKTPVNELKLAEKYRNDYLARMGSQEG